MQLGTYIDGRPLTYDQSTGTFLVGEAPVTAEQVRAYEAAAQLTWANADIATWFHTSFPAQDAKGSGKGPVIAIVAVVALFILIFICGIAVAIAIPVFNAAKTNAQTKSCYANERTIEGAALTYQADNGELPGSLSDIVPAYITEEPQCPVAGPYDYDPETGLADCVEHGHY